MKKVITISTLIFLFFCGLVFYRLKISPLRLDSKIWPYTIGNYSKELIQYRVNSNALMSYTSKNDVWETEIITGTAFDMRYDILFHQDTNVNSVDYSNLTWWWQLFSIPRSQNITVAVSVCKLWLFNCDTTYYKNLSCLKLIYVPRFYQRKRDDIYSWCTIVDISDNDRDSLFFSVKY